MTSHPVVVSLFQDSDSFFLVRVSFWIIYLYKKIFNSFHRYFCQNYYNVHLKLLTVCILNDLFHHLTSMWQWKCENRFSLPSRRVFVISRVTLERRATVHVLCLFIFGWLRPAKSNTFTWLTVKEEMNNQRDREGGLFTKKIPAIKIGSSQIK